ncbi:hypothetical protein [Sulfurospirillum halorespirans]|uniref:Membrane protein n=1 Tax=Sulfurospirillum halorespirans DSM 13726 TaxID=1193502 RepID=A0A1D7TIV2_9BACT|nr:hypothetical protein [Sulfurospirillum halorespirans]AOO64804.1 membrane protein [Sulfurospirillum halorespirans DSM 13726]
MKFEFGDLYKFIVSLGVVLVTLSIIVPWLFLKESFDLFRTQQYLETITEVAKIVIIERQNTTAFIIKYIPFFSITTALIGILLMLYGLIKWYQNQLLIDEQNRLELEIKKQSFRDATKDEIENPIENEFKQNDNQSSNLSTFINRYIEIENKVYKQLFDIYKNNYTVVQNKIIAGIELDILLEGNSMFSKDYLIEVKYIKKGFNYGWLKESFLKNIYAKSVYSQFTNRLPNTLLLIIIEDSAYDKEKYNNLIERIQSERIGRKGKDLIYIATKQEFFNYNKDEIQEKINISA